MTRKALVATGFTLVCLLAAATAAAADPGGQATGYQLDAAHDGFQPAPGFTAPLTQHWTVTEPEYMGGYPIIANGAIYIVMGTSLVAISLSTGQTLWQDPNFASPNYAVPGLAYDNGQIFAMTGQQAYDQVSPGEAAGTGVLKAFDAATGAVDWTANLVGAAYEFTTAPTVANGYVYVQGDGDNGEVFAVSETTGQVAWTQAVLGGDTSPAATSSGVYLELSCNNVDDLNPTTGAFIWQHTTDCSGGSEGASVVSGGNFYGFELVDAPLILSAASGQPLGTFSATKSTPLLSPAVGDGDLYTLNNGTLSATTDNGLGALAWSFKGDGKLMSPPLVAGNVVYESSSAGNLYALNAATGAQLWSTNFPHQLAAGVLAVGDGELAVVSGGDLTTYTGTPVTSSSNPQPGTTSPASNATHVAIPKNRRRPRLPARVFVRRSIRAMPGAWRPAPSRYRYQWLLCRRSGTHCHAIRHSTRRSFRPTPADLGRAIRIRVSASDAGGTSAAVTSRARLVRRARR